MPPRRSSMRDSKTVVVESQLESQLDSQAMDGWSHSYCEAACLQRNHRSRYATYQLNSFGVAALCKSLPGRFHAHGCRHATSHIQDHLECLCAYQRCTGILFPCGIPYDSLHPSPLCIGTSPATVGTEVGFPGHVLNVKGGLNENNRAPRVPQLKADTSMNRSVSQFILWHTLRQQLPKLLDRHAIVITAVYIPLR